MFDPRDPYERYYWHYEYHAISSQWHRLSHWKVSMRKRWR